MALPALSLTLPRRAGGGDRRGGLALALILTGTLAAAAPAAPSPAPVELTLPFDGVWGVVQGFDSGDTHHGYAAFALDFAPPQDVAEFARLARPRLQDFACWGRPVLAPADGRVVRVATHFRDLPPYGKAARKSGGGNFVIIQHAPHLFSELVHLQAGSVRVTVGDSVRRGDAVAACGNSGNARTPHLHLGLLSSITPITTTRAKLSRYEVRAPDGTWQPGDGEPREGEWVRPTAKTAPPHSSSGR